jgi:uncharacterized protein YbcI
MSEELERSGDGDGMVQTAGADGNGMVQTAGADGNGPTSILADVSRAMVSLYKKQFGRGPTKTRTDWAGPDALVCTLEDSLTLAERNLRAMGEHQRLRDVRMLFQYASTKEFIEPVERITGRTVRSFVSGIDTEVDVSIEMFVFHAERADAPSRAERAEAPALDSAPDAR